MYRHSLIFLLIFSSLLAELHVVTLRGGVGLVNRPSSVRRVWIEDLRNHGRMFLNVFKSLRVDSCSGHAWTLFVILRLSFIVTKVWSPWNENCQNAVPTAVLTPIQWHLCGTLLKGYRTLEKVTCNKLEILKSASITERFQVILFSPNLDVIQSQWFRSILTSGVRLVDTPAFLALLTYVSRAHEIEIFCPSSARPSVASIISEPVAWIS